jgi:hypothetical protein
LIIVIAPLLAQSARQVDSRRGTLHHDEGGSDISKNNEHLAGYRAKGNTPMLKKSCVTLLLIAAVLGCMTTARADVIVGTEPEGNGGYGVGYSFDTNVNLIIGQEFTLGSPVVADSITLYLNGDGTDNPQGQFTLQVMDLIGPTATSANVLSTQVGTFPGGILPDGHAPVTFGGLGLPLGPGTYYLVVSSAAGPNTGWGTGATELPSLVGSIGGSFVGIAVDSGVADYTYFNPNEPNDSHANFVINAVPEPSTVLLACCGAIGLLIRGWRVRK